MISIIMPAYNSENYIESSINSVLMQTYEHFELLIIDDGSTDNTFEICKKISKEDHRIKLYSKKNGGVCSARNYGINKAKGEFISFCDNDDTYELDLLNDNLNLAQKYNADVVRWNFKTYIDGKFLKSRNIDDRVINNKEQIALHYLELRETNDAVWNGLFRTSFLKRNNIIFNEYMRYGGEDLNFSLSVLSCNPKIILNKENYYNWYMRTSHSTSGKYNKNFCESMIINADFEFNLVQELKIEKYWPQIREEYYNYILSYASQISPTEKQYYKDILKSKACFQL